MSNAINQILTESALKILRPLLRVMIRNGVACGSFEAIVRKAYVDEAFAMGVENGQKTTVSSVSAQTGLSRKEVKRLIEQENSAAIDIEQKYNRAVRVISGWVNGKNYIDTRGNARVLPISGSYSSFTSLVKEYSGDVTPKAMLDLLLKAECIKLDKENVHLIKHAYVPGKDSAEIIRILGTDTHELLSTIDHNLVDSVNNKRFQRKVSSALLNSNAVEEFKKVSKKKSQALLEDLDAWLTKNEVKPDDENKRYVSLGIYYYEQEGSGEE